MAIGLGDAVLGWLIESAGEKLANWLRGDPARAAMLNVAEAAVNETVDDIVGGLAPDKVEHLRDSLLVYNVGVDSDRVQVTSETELRDALHAWTAKLDYSEFGEPGYLSQLRVDPRLLANTLANRIIAGIKLDGRRGGALRSLAEWLWRDDTSVRLARIEEKIEAAAAPQEPLGGGLPGGTPDFTGRQQVLAELAARVQAHDPAGTVVAIHSIDGMAGIGKTELAIRAAYQHKHRYPDGQYFINLHGYTEGIPPLPPLAALEELLRQAGVPGQAIPADLASRQARWQALMATRRTLVLLDNALDVDQIRPLLPNAAGCLVLITSRTRLRGLPGARALPLDVLPPAEAVELFTRLVEVGRQLDLDAVARVVDLVGRLPVAVQAVAGQVDDGYTEADLVDDLAEATAGLGLVDQASPLGAGVHAAFETSIRRLDHAQRRAFRVLGVHPGPSIGVPQFAALADLPIASARAMLRGLADRNLIMAARGRVGHRRYQLHDLMREFARGQAASHLSKEDQGAAITRLTAWYAAAMSAVARLREGAGSDPGESGVEGLDLDQLATAHLWMAAEQDNLLAYAQAATGLPAAEVFQQAASNLYRLDYHTAAQALYHTAAARYQQAGDRDGEADARRGQGEATRLIGDYPGAVAHFRAAQRIYRELGDRDGEADARRGQGEVALLIGDYRGAVAHFRTAQRTFRELGNRSGDAAARLGLGHVALSTGDYPGAVEHFRAAQRTFKELGYRSAEADAWRGLGRVAVATGDHPGAVDYFRAAQRIYKEIGNRGGEAAVLCGLGDVAHEQGRRDEAREQREDALRILEEIGSPSAAAVRDLLAQLDLE